jgi:hypothetical protein
MFPSIVGIVLIGIILLLVIFFPCPTSSQFFVFRIVLSIAVAGFASIIPGFLRIKYNGIITAGGALAVFVLVYIFNPGTIITENRCNEPFDFTIFLQDSAGNSVLKNSGNLILQIENDKRIESIDEKGSATFKQIPFNLKDGNLTLQLEATGWQFVNGKTAVEIKLQNKSNTVIVKKDNSLCCVSGSVRDEENNLLNDVIVSIGDFADTTRDNGRFLIDISPEKQKPEQTLIAYKANYKIFETFVYPATEQEVKIILHKK